MKYLLEQTCSHLQEPTPGLLTPEPPNTCASTKMLLPTM